MKSRLAEIKDGVVANIIIGSPSKYPAYVDVTEIQANIGWLYDGNTFTEPTPITTTTPHLVKIKDIVQIFPFNTQRLCREIISSANYNTPAEAASADTADVVLAILQAGDPINVNSPRFTPFANWLIANTDVEQSHIDSVRG